jgi:alkylation response protein AidB-like acyl-CoA dehydrogenase
MNFTLSGDQEMFRATIRAFVDAEIRPVARAWEQSGRYPTEIVAGLAELGLFGMTVPESYGGLALDLVSLAIVFEELSRGWMGIAGILGSHSLSCAMIARHGTEEQKAHLLPHRARRRHRPPGDQDRGPTRR